MPVVGISDIQGAGHVSPFVGRCVRDVAGVVTAILGSRSGQAFWLQDADGDNDPDTSDGLLITVPEGMPEVVVGDQLRLAGRVEETGMEDGTAGDPVAWNRSRGNRTRLRATASSSHRERWPVDSAG